MKHHKMELNAEVTCGLSVLQNQKACQVIHVILHETDSQMTLYE